MKYIGLTGSVGVGKSTIAEMFAKLGAKIITADLLARKITSEDQSTIKILQANFPDSFSNQGKLDRQQLAKTVFKNHKKLDTLNSIMQPIIHKIQIEEIKKIFAEDAKATIIYEAALLMEQNLDNFCQKIILVIGDSKLSFERIGKERNLDLETFEAILKNQLPQPLKQQRADYIINNQYGKDELNKQVLITWKKIVKLPHIDYGKTIEQMSNAF